MRSAADDLGWLGIFRLGLVQAALGAMVVLTTSTLNRVMVVELGLPALLPGILVALHYAVQISRPRMGFGSDVGGRRTPWIVGGLAVLALGAVGAAMATAWMGTSRPAGIALALFCFVAIGFGVSASGTNLLALLAKRVAPQRRAPAATILWMMMILGFAVTAGLAGKLLEPYSPVRLVAVMALVCGSAFVLALLALRGVEGRAGAGRDTAEPVPPPFRRALAQVWAEPDARRFTIFIFVSMLAYSAQDLILEPFAGTVFAYTPGQTTQLSGLQHGGVLAGLVLAGQIGPGWPLATNVFLLGAANGAFSIAAIGSMMRLAGQGRQRREGVRMGLWGAAQALAFGLGGLAGAAASDLARWLIGSPGAAYACVFALEALLFLVAARLATCIDNPAAPALPQQHTPDVPLAHAGTLVNVR